MENTFVTGASGFLGRNLTPKLDSFTAIPHEKIVSTNWEDATRVFFLSTYGNMSTHTNDWEIMKANVVDLAYVLKEVNWSKITSFVFVSSSSVKLKVQTMYSRTKRAAEELLLAYMEKYDVPITIIRPFSITGVGEQENHLIPTLIRKIHSGEEVELSPLPVHDFIDVSDVAHGILNLSKNKAKGIFELGSGISYSNQEVLDIVEDRMGKKAKVKIVHGIRPYDNEEWVSTNFKSRKWGWVLRKDLPISVSEMVNAYAAK